MGLAAGDRNGVDVGLRSMATVDVAAGGGDGVQDEPADSLPDVAAVEAQACLGVAAMGGDGIPDELIGSLSDKAAGEDRPQTPLKPAQHAAAAASASAAAMLQDVTQSPSTSQAISQAHSPGVPPSITGSAAASAGALGKAAGAAPQSGALHMVILVGLPGSGKSTFCANLIRQCSSGGVAWERVNQVSLAVDRAVGK